MENVFVPLPMDSVQHRMEMIWELQHASKGIKGLQEGVDAEYDAIERAVRHLHVSKAI
jgi:hypothetical protein